MVSLYIHGFQKVGYVKLWMITFDERGMSKFRIFTKQSTIVVHAFLEVFARSIAQMTISVAVPIASEMKGYGTGAFKFELVFVGKAFDNI